MPKLLLPVDGSAVSLRMAEALQSLWPSYPPVRDAVLAYDGTEPMTDASGQPLTRWDGETYKPHPVTGQQVPDEAAQVVQWRYLNPRQAQWPKADFIVGNPPFIGNKRMRVALGDGYADALRAAWPEVPESAD